MNEDVWKMSDIIEFQQQELHCAQAEELHRRDQQLLHAQLLQQNWELREAHDKSQWNGRVKEVSEFHITTLLQDEDWSRITTLFWNYQAEYKND